MEIVRNYHGNPLSRSKGILRVNLSPEALVYVKRMRARLGERKAMRHFHTSLATLDRLCTGYARKDVVDKVEAIAREAPAPPREGV